MKKKQGAPSGNQNALRGDHQRKAITIRLQPELIEKLRARGNITRQIEQALLSAQDAPNGFD